MKKRFVSVFAVILAALSFVFCGCSQKQPQGNGPENPPEEKTAVIRLRSDDTQSLKVGEKLSIVYSVYNSKSEVEFKSSDDGVVTVDRFATVTAEGAGTAVVTLSLKDDPTVTAKVTFNVTRNNFMTLTGYYNGNIDFGTQETGGDVSVKSGQVQLLANAPGQYWFFKTHIDHMGVAANDSGGFWGVGSFLVNAANPIGNIMYWYMLRRTAEGQRMVQAYYGGWRYATTVPADSSTLINDVVYNAENGVDFTIIRYGTMHYVIAEFGEGEQKQSYKHSFDVPLFADTDTYPGVLSQNQMLTVSDYSMSNDRARVEELLQSFQLAESIGINGLTAELTAGEYMLTSTVLPVYTINKGVTYALKSDTDGVKVEANGALTVAESAVGKSFTVLATAVSDTSVTAERTYTVVQKSESESTLFDTGAIIKNDAVLVSPSGNAVSVSNDPYDTYIPLNARSEKWMLTATVENRTTGAAVAGTEIGVMSATGGFMDYVKLGIEYSYAAKSDISFDAQSGDRTLFESAAAGGLVRGTKNTLGLIRDGDDYYVVINGKFTKKITVRLGVDSMPVLYSLGTGARFTDVSLLTDGAQIDAYVKAQPYYVGGYVTSETAGEYRLEAVDLGQAGTGGDTLDWPPDNDYCNGIKSATAFDGNFQIEFTMSNITPLSLAGIWDAKILVYLKSERVTSSLQFVIKKEAGSDVPSIGFTPNLDDATWKEYALPDSVDIMNGETKVKVVRKADCVELYLNDVRVFADEQFMQNTGFWTDATVSTPGIGSFMCGVTITDPAFTAIAD